MRPIWKGHIRFSLVTIPVRVYNAIETAETVRFNQLHQGCNGNIGYDKRCKKCGTAVTMQEIVKGYQYEPDKYVILEPADFDKVKLQSTRIIEIEGFVDSAEVHPTLYESPYLLGPDSEVGAKTYALLCEALRDSGKVGVGKVVLRDREDVVVLAPHEGGLLLYRLRYPAEVRSMQDVPELKAAREIDREQLKLARHLLETMATSMDRIEMRDRYTEALREMIDAKVQGRDIVVAEEETRPVVDIMAALKQSIEQAQQQRQRMVKATGKAGKAKAEPADQPAPAKKRKRA